LAAIRALPLSRPVRILNLSGDHERVISLSELRRALPDRVELVSGPGCPATICPEDDLQRALEITRGHPVTLCAAENLMRLPFDDGHDGLTSLHEAQQRGDDIREIVAPMEAVVMARERPEREMVLFVAGFETLLAPLAGMILEGLPDNLSLLVSGRRIVPLVERLLSAFPNAIDALLLPGNRCAVTGTGDWDRLVARHRKPAAVAGYTYASIVAAIHAVLQQHCGGEARVDNLYRLLARREGNALARDQLERVFEVVDGDLRGLGRLHRTAYRLRCCYEPYNAERRYPSTRSSRGVDGGDMPQGCQCADVVIGSKAPVECRLFSFNCTPSIPYGPCMASEDGACFLRRNRRNVA